MARLIRTRGYLALVGESVESLVKNAFASFSLKDNYPTFDPTHEPYHISLITKQELQNLHEDKLSNLDIDIANIVSLGVGGHPKSSVFFLVVLWSAGQNFRKRLRLPPKQFHITLSQNDDHGTDKGIHSLLHRFPSEPSAELLDHFAFNLHIFGDYSLAKQFAADLCQSFTASEKGFLRLGDAALSLQEYKVAMLSYACAFERSNDAKLKNYCVRKITKCSKETEWGCLFMEGEVPSVPDSVLRELLVPWGNELRSIISECGATPTLCIESQLKIYIPSTVQPLSYKLPRFFRWLIPFHLAIMSTPRNGDDIQALCSPHLGIRHVLTLTEETPLDSAWFNRMDITNTFLPIPNYHPPSIEQMDLIMRLLQDDRNLPLLIHCGGGKGRAGTVAACYMVACGFQKFQEGMTSPTMTSKDAITALRSIRPGSIETSQQEVFVAKFASTIWKRQSILPYAISEPPPCSLIVEGTLGHQDSNLLLLVGLPGSGKSWFSNALLARGPETYIRISQDESRSRSSCENEIGHDPGKRKVILDRCNTSAGDRKGWLKLAHWATNPICVLFDFEPELCIYRAQNRANHPTLPPGGRVRSAVDQMLKSFVKPSLKEGFKAIFIIRSFEVSQNLVMRMSSPITLYKFPRTTHLVNLGAASDDDIVASDLQTTIPIGARVVITEKVDGANMGFSLSSDRSILIQNRSHYITPASHEQFKKLGLWVDKHRTGLYEILDRDTYFAERYILFGEWLAATHSIQYTKLPDRFMAYDLYDRSTGLWTDRETLAAYLERTGIGIVPVLHESDAMPSEQQLKEMVQMESKFYDGRVEGVYVKVEKDRRVLSRGKVVRSDFISGNDHWGKGILKLNSLQSGDDHQEVEVFHGDD